jgi:hypothetical protein
MAARHPPVGIAHPTVVPENFDPDRPEREGKSEGGEECLSEDT